MLIGYFRWQKEKVVAFLEKYDCWNVEWCNTVKDFLKEDTNKDSKTQDPVKETAKETEKVTTQEKETPKKEESETKKEKKEEKKVKKEEKSEYDFRFVNPTFWEYYDLVVNYFQLEKNPEEWETFQKLPRKFFDFEYADFTDEENTLLEEKKTFWNWKIENYKISNEKLGLAFELMTWMPSRWDFFLFYVDKPTYQVKFDTSGWYGIIQVWYNISEKFDVPQEMTFFGEEYVLDLGEKNQEHGWAIVDDERNYDYFYIIHGGDNFFYPFTSQKEAEDLVTAYIKESGTIKGVYGITFEKYPGMVFKYVHKTAKAEHTYIFQDPNEEYIVPLVPFIAVVPDALEIQTDENGTITDEKMIDALIDKVQIVNIDLGSRENIKTPEKYQQLVTNIGETMCKMGLCKGGSYIISAYGKEYGDKWSFELWDYYHNDEKIEEEFYDDYKTKPLFVLQPAKVPGYKILKIADDIELCIGSVQASGCW